MATRLSDDEKAEIWRAVGAGESYPGDRAPAGSVGVRGAVAGVSGGWVRAGRR